VYISAHTNEEMQGSGASLRLDLNLDHRSTNYPHCDFWFVQSDSPSGQSYDGSKYSINVTGQGESGCTNPAPRTYSQNDLGGRSD
jgi:hypothetical protein